MKGIVRYVGFVLFILALGGPLGRAAETPAGPPDLTKAAKAGAGGDWNLGPTGLSGWIYVTNSYTAEARQILVCTVEKGSPADGVLQTNEVILGVGGKLFAGDARRAFGLAIGEAEQDGLLKLRIWRPFDSAHGRQGKQQALELKLKIMAPGKA